MDVPLAALASTARTWDEQHLDLESAAHQVAQAPTGGFTATVSGTADRFTTAWARHVTGVADTSETYADGLRRTSSDLVTTDGAVARDAALLTGLVNGPLKEVR